MGFLEDLRRQEDARRRNLDREVERLLPEVRTWKENVVKLKKLREQAEAYLNRSDFPKLVEEFNVLKEHPTIVDLRQLMRETTRVEVKRDVLHSSSLDYPRDGTSRLVNAEINVAWDHYRKTKIHEEGTEIWEGHKYILIECNPDGEMSIIAKDKQILPLDQWLGNSAIQEKALDVALENPAVSSFHHISRRDTTPLGDYGI